MVIIQSHYQTLFQKLTKFGGTLREDVIKWLQDTEDVFDRVQLQSANKYIAAQSYLTATAAIWFRYNKSTVRDWF
ncbi:unnamed protein product, partial [Rotaria sordida]